MAFNGKVVSKVDHYNWSKIGKQGRFRMVDKEAVLIDHDYQRTNVSQFRVLSIARDFCWTAFGVLLCVERSDKTLWCFDGQHRKLGADKRSEIRQVPCLVFSADDIKEEAKNFLLANHVRGPVQSLDKYRALLVAEDPTAIAVRDMLANTGHHIANNGQPSSVRCVAFLMSAYRLDPDTLRSVWPMICRLCLGEQITDEIAKAFFVTERILKRTEQGSLGDKHNRQSLENMSAEKVSKAIAAAKAYFGGGEKSCARGLVDCLNYRRTSKRIDLEKD